MMNTKTKIIAGIAIAIVSVGLLTALFKAISGWYDTHEVVFNKVLQIKLSAPVTIKNRQVEVREIVKVINEIPNPVDLKTEAEKYVYQVFGIENYKIAIAIMRSESGERIDAWNVNSNGSIDIGLFQINSTHFKEAGCSLSEVTTLKGNVDCAYKIYQASGWNPWTAFKNGAFIGTLK